MPTEQKPLPAALRQQLAKQETQHRHLQIETRAIDAETRTIELALSSEYPVNRGWGLEVLEHTAEAIDLSRLQDGAPLLFNHNFDAHVGVVESVRIDADRRVRVQVRLGKSARATELWDDIQDGILRHVSVGYQIHAAQLTETRDDGMEVWTITRWTPYEVSLVTVPADPTVGIGRSAAAEQTAAPAEIETPPETLNIETQTEERTMPAPVAPAAPTAEQERQQARTDELARARSIRAIAAKLNLTEEGERAIHDGASVDQFRELVLDSLTERAEAQQAAPSTMLGLSTNEVKRFSVMRAVEAAVSRNWSNAGFELECSNAIADIVGREARGFFVPFDVQTRAMSTGTGSAGGNLVGTDHMAGEFIESLRAQSLLGRLGARFLTGLVGDVDIPRLDAGAAFNWIAEGADGTESDAVIGLLNLTPKTITGQVPFTRKLRKQSSPAVEDMLLADMQLGAALGIDKAGLEGAADGPAGIIAATGVATQTIALAGSPTWAEMVGFRTKVALGNALRENLAFVMHPTVGGNCMTKTKDAGSGRFIMEDDKIAGFRVEETTQVIANRIMFGNFRDVVVALWGVLDVFPDEAALAKSGGLVLRVFQDADIGVRHGASFAINA